MIEGSGKDKVANEAKPAMPHALWGFTGLNAPQQDFLTKLLKLADGLQPLKEGIIHKQMLGASQKYA